MNQFKVWVKFGPSNHPMNPLMGHMIVSEDRLMESLEAMKKLRAEVWLVQPLDNDEER